MARPQRIYHVHRGGRKLQVPRNENDDDEEQEMPESEEGESDSKDGNYDEEGNSSETPDEEDDVDDNDYDDEEDSLDGMANNGRKRRSNRSVAQRPVRARRSVGSTSYREVDEDEEFELENNEPPPKDKPAPRNKSRKGSNKRSRRNAKFTSKLQQDDDETYSSEEDVKPKATPRRRTFADIENDDEESFKVEDESEEENYESEESEGVERRHAGKRKRGRPKKQPDSSNEEEEYASEDEEEERPIRTPQRKRGRPKKTVSRRKKSVVDEDSDDDKEDVGWTPTSRKSTRGSTSRSSRRSSRIASNRPSASRELDEDDGDSNHSNADELEDDDLIFPASISRRTTPPRTSATIASRNISSAAKSKHGESSDEEEEPTESPSPRRRKAHLSSDEEFLEDDSEVDGVHETDSDDIVDDGDFEDDDSSLEQPTSASRPSYNVDTEQVGTMDDSSSSEDENARKLLSTPRGKSQDSGAFSRSELTPRPHRPKGMDDSSSSDSSDSEIDAARASENTGSLGRPRLPKCSSIEDAITGETLPKRHVCYFSPDGSSKQCFALETLRQIALTSSQRNFRTDLIGEDQQVAFLQPPHFRTVMSAFYMDQIASRFGRGALNIHGEYYNRKPSEPGREGGTLESSSSDEDAFNEVGSYHYSQSFHDDLQRYIDRQMGSQDVYACPLCYSEMHTRVDNPSREDESEDGDDGDIEDSSQFVESKYDPMLVLGYLDNDQFQAASSFCFTKVANIKKHLRDDHHVDTKGIQGNDLYARFKVRAPDGLLQRYLKKSFQYGTSRQGDMRRYWNAGNNYNFVHLLYMIQKANRHRNRLNGRQDEDNNNMATNHDNEETPEDYFEVAQDFFASFQNRARRLWGRLSSPFQTSKVDDLKDFLAADDDYEEEEDAQEALAHRQVDSLRQDPQEDSNDFISKIQRKYAETSSVEYDDGEEDDEEDGDSELEIVGKPPATLGEDNEDTEMNGYYSVEEEVSDPWEVSIKQKIKRKKLSKVSPSATPKVRKKISRKSRNGSLSASAQKRGTHTLEDSDSDF